MTEVVKTNASKILAKKFTAQKLIAKLKPKLIITTHDPGPSSLTFVTAAQSKKISTLVLLHGAPSAVHYFYSDQQLIWGPLIKRQLVRRGVRESQLTLGSYPIYYDYLNYFHHSQHHSIRPTIGVITTGDGSYEWYQTLYFWDLFKALRSSRHYRFMIRTHGMQHLEALTQLADYFGISIELNPLLHLEEFIAQSDVIITQNSTAALVPLLAHKPTILLDPWFPLLDEGLIKSSRAFIRLKNLLQLGKPINVKSPSRFLRQFCGPLNFQAAESLAQKIQPGAHLSLP